VCNIERKIRQSILRVKEPNHEQTEPGHLDTPDLNLPVNKEKSQVALIKDVTFLGLNLAPFGRALLFPKMEIPILSRYFSGVIRGFFLWLGIHLFHLHSVFLQYTSFGL